jgi:hypothetical protein
MSNDDDDINIKLNSRLTLILALCVLMLVFGFFLGKIYARWQINNMQCFTEDKLITICEDCIAANQFTSPVANISAIRGGLDDESTI